MNESLSSQFQRSKGAPIQVMGHNVNQIFHTEVEGNRQDFLIRRVSAKSSPVPGLRIKAANGEIEVNGQRHSEIILWADTSPELVEIAVLSKSGCELKIWNVWRSNDVANAWVGNAGLLISNKDGVTTLECSDGVGDVDFSSLVAQIQEA